MGGLRSDRWVKEQLIHGVNDNDILTDVMNKLTTMKHTSIVTSEQLVAWARQGEGWWPQTAVFDSLKETKGFDAIKSGIVEQKLKQTSKAQEQTKKHCGYYGFGHPHWQCTAYWKKCGICGNTKHFKVVHRSSKDRMDTIHKIEQEATSEKLIDKVHIDSIRSNSKWSVIVAKLQMSSSEHRTYKNDTGSDGNIMLIHFFQNIVSKSNKQNNWWQ